MRKVPDHLSYFRPRRLIIVAKLLVTYVRLILTGYVRVEFSR